MFTKTFWLNTAERAAKSAAQFGVIAWTAATFTVVGDVVSVAEATGLAMLAGGVASVLTSVASTNVGKSDSPSLLSE